LITANLSKSYKPSAIFFAGQGQGLPGLIGAKTASRPALGQAALAVAQQMEEKFPGTMINYLEFNLQIIN
jgi:hypothetical protein